MTLTPAPYFEDIAGAPAGGRAWWLQADDGIRVRIGHWRAPGKPLGTYLIFPGRTEFVEKYGVFAGNLTAAGYDAIAIDWRGQGLADRLLPDGRIGHVETFDDYQRDVRAVLDALPQLGVPKPLFLLGHSMGGCIGLRALYRKIPVAGAVFTGPMWGIRISAPVRPAAWAVSWTSRQLGLGHHFAPSTGADSYVVTAPFQDNLLTRDPGMFDFMKRQIEAHPELGLGGPSLHWLHEALRETRALAALPAPDVPCVTFVGDNERIVSVPRIRERMATWPRGKLEVLKDAEHEVLMEGAEVRARIFALTCQHFEEAYGITSKKDAATA